MTWTKISDDFTDDCWTFSDSAFRLHVEGLVWANRKLLDLRLDKTELRRWAKNPDAASELVAAGWWDDRGDYYLIVHHGVYQRSAEEVLAQQARSRANGKKGGRPPGPPRETAPRKRPITTQVGSDGRTGDGTQVGSNNQAGNPDGLATGLASGIATGFSENEEPQDKTQPGNPVANPEGRAGRSSKGDQLLDESSVKSVAPKPALCSKCHSRPAQGDPHPLPSLCTECFKSEKHSTMRTPYEWHGFGPDPYEEYV